jgi:hypothetical protein
VGEGAKVDTTPAADDVGRAPLAKSAVEFRHQGDAALRAKATPKISRIR